MSAFDYGRLRQVADSKIARFGQEAVLSRPTSTGPAHNPVEGEPDTYSVRIVVETYRQNEIDGTRVLRSDLKVMMSKGALAIEPETTDQLLIGGQAHAIVDVRPVSPGGVVLYFEIQARR